MLCQGKPDGERQNHRRLKNRQISDNLGDLAAIEALADVVGAGGAAEVAVEFFALDLLQMGGLGEEEQFVNGADVDVLGPAQVHAQAEVAEEIERILAGD